MFQNVFSYNYSHIKQIFERKTVSNGNPSRHLKPRIVIGKWIVEGVRHWEIIYKSVLHFDTKL